MQTRLWIYFRGGDVTVWEHQSDVRFCRAANLHTWSIFDPISQRTYVIDTGSCRSLIAANDMERSSPPQARLKAVNGTDILVYGERPVELQLGSPPRIVTFLLLIYHTIWLA